MNAPELKGIHHLKIAVSNLDEALKFYEAALNAERIPQFDHKRVSDGALYAYILKVPGLGTALELRLHPERAAKHRGFDPVTISVESRAVLEEWERQLTERGVRHSPVITAIYAWIIVLEDPDGNRLRLYTLESHGPELKPEEDNEWLQN